MTTTAIEYCGGFCKSSAHYVIYPYSYNHEDIRNDDYYVRTESHSGDVQYIKVYRTQSGHYTSQVINESQYLSPSPGEFYYSDSGSDIVGLPVSRYVHTYGVDFFGCFLIGAVLCALLGGVCNKCMKS